MLMAAIFLVRYDAPLEYPTIWYREYLTVWYREYLARPFPFRRAVMRRRGSIDASGMHEPVVTPARPPRLPRLPSYAPTLVPERTPIGRFLGG